jgi:hypothetical protein
LFGTKSQGCVRDEIARESGVADGGNLTKILEELIESRFVREYKPFGGSKKGVFYQLSDPFIGFHLEFMEKFESENYWSAFTDNSKHRVWTSYRVP